MRSASVVIDLILLPSFRLDVKQIPSVNQGYTELTHWTHFFLDLALLDIRFLEYNPSDFAAVAVAFARCLHACPSYVSPCLADCSCACCFLFVLCVECHRLLPIQVLAECSFEDDQDPSLHHGMVCPHYRYVRCDIEIECIETPRRF
jgi:hypothetical protein